MPGDNRQRLRPWQSDAEPSGSVTPVRYDRSAFDQALPTSVGGFIGSFDMVEFFHNFANAFAEGFKQGARETPRGFFFPLRWLWAVMTGRQRPRIDF